MSHSDADRENKDSRDQNQPMDAGAVDGRKENKILAENMESKTQKKCQEKWPNRLIAIASLVLVMVTGYYAYHAREQTELTKETLEAYREESRLDHRPWVGYHGYSIQARKDSTDLGHHRDPKQGEEFRIRCFLQNTGRTPALDVQPMDIKLDLLPMEGVPPEPVDWSGFPDRRTIFPSDESLSHNSDWFKFTDQEFLEYSALEKQLFFWARTYYCDHIGRRHWTQVGGSRTYGARTTSVMQSSVGSIPGDIPHHDCNDN